MKGNLLIVDDEPILLKTMQYSLKSLADSVWTAMDGVSALDIIVKENIHCVLSDFSMPGMSGMDLVRELRRRSNIVPFIIFTGHATPEDFKVGASLGVLDFIEKPGSLGLQEIVKHGLRLGVNPDETGVPELKHVSEYRKLLLSGSM